MPEAHAQSPAAAPRPVEHDPGWAQAFAHEQMQLVLAFGAFAVAIEHVGSTAVPDLRADPTIDVLAGSEVFPPLPKVVIALQGVGYVREDETAHELLLVKAGTPGFHLRLVEFSGERWFSHLALRNLLRADAGARSLYEERRRELAMTNAESYAAGKALLIEELLAAG